jgi:alpha-beta hydrolase superfamily lysophospholipase
VPSERLLLIMNLGYSRALGVSCTHCHMEEDFSSDDKRPRRAAREMAAMHRMINDQLKKEDGESTDTARHATAARSTLLGPSGDAFLDPTQEASAWLFTRRLKRSCLMWTSRLPILFLLAILPLIVGLPTSDAQTASQPDEYGVGFRVAHHLDLARDWSGGSTPGRPLRVFLWYPARPAAGRPMTFGDYIDHPMLLAPPIFGQLDGVLNARTTGSFVRWLQADRFAELKRSPVAARLDATPAPGTFPVIVYSSGLNDSFEASNSYLFEFLASQGFIVITIPQLGATVSTLDLGTGAADLEVQTRDLEQALGWLRSERPGSLGPTVAMGHSMGGSVALLAATRHPSFRAVIGLDASYAAPGLATTVAANPLFDARRLTAPLLDIRRADSQWDFSLVSTLSAAPRRLVQVHDMSHMSFTNDARIAADYLADPKATLALRGYQFSRDVVLAFLKTVLSGESDALAGFDRYLRSRSSGIADVTITP